MHVVLHSVCARTYMSYIHRSCLFVEVCAAMRVNEYVSQLSSSLQLSWTEAEAQLEGRVTVKKKSRVKISLREQENIFCKRQRGESVLEVMI